MQKHFLIEDSIIRLLVRSLSALSILLLPHFGFAASKIYHHTPDGKTYFELSDKKILVKFSSQISFDQQARIFANEPLLKPLTKDMIMPAPKVVLAELASGAQEKDILDLINRLHSHPDAEYANPFLVYTDGTLEAAQDIVAIKLKDGGDFSTMEEMVKRNGAIIKEQYKYDPLLFFIKVNKQSSAKALELANLFAESGKFATAEPDMLKLLKPYYSTNDSFLNYQWALNNTGSSIQYNGTAGADMKVFSAWDISRGSSTIKVAIIDEGVDLNHPDLLANLLPGFDGTGLGSNGGPSGNDAHGTACAGIVAGVGNNSLGVAGVAHLCKIIPVRIAYSNTSGNWVTTNSQIGTSIDWAWNQGGADVLSNSWGGGSSSTLINDPITRSNSQGRGGLGAPVLFAAGNSNGANSYPATLSNVVSVVAMSMCNQRKTPSSCDGETWWGSNFGTGVDIAAPGVKIYTTDISGSAGYSSGDYAPTFNGTSSACPNAAGVMALILSVNSTLNVAQARQVIESTCRKVGGYTYNSGVSGQPNGTWSTDLGHGMVDAYTALQVANPQPCTTPTVGGTASGPSSFAAGSNASFSLTGQNGDNIQWQSSSNGGSSYSDIGGAINANSTFTLAGGTYKIRAAVSRINCTTSYSNVLDVSVSSPLGDVLGNPIVASLPFSTTVSNATGFANDYTGTNNQASADIFFRFTTGPCTDSIRISSCASGFDTYIHLLNSAGTWIVSNDDNGPLCTGTRASLKQFVQPNTTYYVVAEGYSTSTGSISLTINEVDNPTFSTSITAGGPTTFCAGGSVSLTAIGGSTYLWNTGATTQSIAASSSGNYSVIVTNGNGCSASSSQSVTVHTLPSVSISANGPTTFCAGGSVNLTASSGSSYFWNNGATTQTISVTAPGTYSCIVTDANGCSNSASQVVNINPLPEVVISAGGPTTFCEGGSVILTATEGTTYLWNTGETTQSITTTISGSYSCTVTNSNGCSAPNTATVTVNPLPSQFLLSGIGTYCSVPGTGATGTLSGSEIGISYEFKFTAGGSVATIPGNGSVLTINNITSPTGGTLYAVATNSTTGCSQNMNGSMSIFQQPASTWYRDQDVDGYGDPNNSIQACSQPLGYITNNQDCNDNASFINPGTSEICGNGIDDNCNGSTDEGCETYTFYADADGDSYGNPSSSITQSSPVSPSGYVSNNLDCDDSNLAVNPAAMEICNGIDDNCDGTIDNNTPALGSATAISGPAGVCRNSTGQIFTVDPIPGATSYVWTLPTGATGNSTTNSISVAFSSTYVTGNICVRAANSCLQGSNFCRSVIYYSSKPGTPGTITGTTPVCPGVTASYSIAAVANATSYNWTAPANATILSGQGTTSVTISFASNYVTASVSVTASNCLGSSTARTLSVAKKALPATPGVVTGTTPVCPGNTFTYSIVPVANTDSYTWTAPANASIVSGQGTNSVQVSFLTGFVSGSLTVIGTNCIGNSASRAFALTTIPATPASISGPLYGICGGTTQTYSCPTVSGATTYAWTVPAGAVINSGLGTNSINVTLPTPFASGTVTVKAGTPCTLGVARSITIRSVPVAPAIITGPTTQVCGTKTYSIGNSTSGGTSYTWIAPAGATIVSGQGTTSVNILFAPGFITGNVGVTSNNACGSSAVKNLAVRSVPLQPGTIAGQANNLCGTTATYTIAAVSTASSYNWSAPAGCSVVNNNGVSADIFFPSGFISGSVSVSANNTCGTGTARTLAVVGKPGTPAAIVGPGPVCPGATGLVYSTTNIAGLTYNWTKPASVSLVSGQGTSSATMNWGTVAGPVTVSATNACGTSLATSKTIAIAACRNGAPLDYSEEIEIKDVSVYPNPGSGLFQLEFKGILNDGFIQIFNMQGQIVHSTTIKSEMIEKELNLNHLPAGAYLLKFHSDNFQKDLKIVKF